MKKDFVGEIAIDYMLYLGATIFLTIQGFVLEWPKVVAIFIWLQFIIMSFALFNKRVSLKLYSFIFATFTTTAISFCGLYEKNYIETMVLLIGSICMSYLFRNYKLIIYHCILTSLAVASHLLIFKCINIDSEAAFIDFVATVIIMIGISVALAFCSVREENIRSNLELTAQEARSAQQSKSDFLANMSHEIRTPMNAIIGMCELALRDSDINNNVRECCENIKNSGRSLLSIINDILDFSKIESGKMEIIEDEFNISSTLNDVINMSVTRMGDKNLELIVDVDPTIPKSLIGDELRIRQIIINMMTNAIKYTNEGIVKLQVTKNIRDYGINLNVAITDSGIGITPENLEKLFSSFQQVDTKKNRAVEGTGLGLAITKKLLNQMGGFINVESEYGKGSTFRVVIPLKVKDTEQFITINNSESINAVGFFTADQIENEAVKDVYLSFIANLGKKINLKYRYFYDFERLKKRLAKGDITHCFVNAGDYFEYQSFFDAIAESTKIIVVQNRRDAVNLKGKNVRSMYKPLYALSIASILNNEDGNDDMADKQFSSVSFSAPKARILIVDDNSINLQVASGLMKPYNMQIFTAGSGADAIKMLETKEYDLVFMDHMMPVMDGVEATGIIRAKDDEYYKNLKIIALTANAVQGAHEMFLANGFNGFLAKPIELGALDRVLKSHLPQEYIEKSVSTEVVESVEVNICDETRDALEGFIDLKTGYSYTGNNKDSYDTILKSYIKKGKERTGYIQKLFDDKEWKDYVIEVHALKSSSLTIGAVELSELAKELELSGKAGNIGNILDKNDSLLNLYEQVIAAASVYVNNELEAAEEMAVVKLSQEELINLFTQIADAIDSFDSDAVLELIADKKNSEFEGENISELFTNIEDAAKDFNYDPIIEMIDEFKSNHALM